MALAACLVLAGTVADAADPPVTRIGRVEQWLKAIPHHEPDRLDAAVTLVASWSPADVRTLWIDANNLVLLMRHPRAVRFDIRQPWQRTVQAVRYTPSELRRLVVLACAASGLVTQPECLEAHAPAQLDAELLQLAHLAAEARLHGDQDRYILRRGALLHADVAMLTPGSIEPVNTGGSLGPQRIRAQISDGREVSLGQTEVHWELARMLLDHVKPHGTGDGELGRDEMVRQWYHATAAWMQWRQNYDSDHLDRAREIFPDDPDILFLSGSLRETYAGSRIQNAVRAAFVPTGVRMDVGSDRAELRRAETFLRRALAAKPDASHVRLHLGHVLLMLGRPADAAGELTRALAALDDDLLRYYGELFLGAAREALGTFDAARDSYARAAELQPAAQSPLLALSALARRRGDRTGALREIRRVFDLESTGSADDPWWTYHTSQARDAFDLIEALVKPFQSGVER